GANNKLLAYLRTHGYPAPEIASRDVVVDHATHTVDVIFHVAAGTRAEYGDARYAGLEKVRPVVVDRLVPWEEGETYDGRELPALRTRLYATGLVATASVEPLTDELTERGEVPIRLALTERPHHTMTAGIEYKSD